MIEAKTAALCMLGWVAGLAMYAGVKKLRERLPEWIRLRRERRPAEKRLRQVARTLFPNLTRRQRNMIHKSDAATAAMENFKNTWKDRKCVICGCTDDHACEGGCYWVYPKLCSVCAEKLTGYNSKCRMYPVSAGCGDILIIECSCHLDLAGLTRAEEIIRDTIAEQKDKQPGLLIMGEGFRLAGIIHGCDNDKQREGPRDE